MLNRIDSYFRRVAHGLRLRGPLAGDVRARTLHGLVVGLLLYIWIVHLPIMVPLFVVRKAGSTLANLFLTLIYGITLALLKRGSLRQASVFFLVGTWLAATAFVVLGGGMQSTALVHYVNLPILAAWLLGTSAAGLTTAVCLGSSLVLAVLQQSGVPLPHYFPGAPFGNWSSVAMATLGAVVPVLFVLSALNEALEKRQLAEEERREANEKLEQRVKERTAQLEDEVTERKRLEADLELAARFPGENPNPVMRLGQGHFVDFANPPAQELLKTVGCSVGGEAPAEIGEPAVAALIDGVPRQIEGTYAGRTYLFSLSPSPQWGYVNLYATDITDRKQAEEAIRESESRERARSAEFEALMESAPVGIFRSDDTECRWISGNRAAYDLLRRPRGSNLSKSGPEDEKPVNFRAMKDGKEIPLPELPMQRAAATGQAVWDHEMDFVFEDGVTVNVLGNAVPLLDESGRPRGAVGTFLDITTRKRAEEALRASEERFRVLAEAMPQIAWSADATGIVDYINPYGLEYAGVRLEDLGGWKWTSFVHPYDLAPMESGWRRALAAGESDQIEHRLRRADGEFRWHLTRAVPLRDEKGEVIHWIGTATDIHDQKMAAQELERRVAERTAELARSTALLETVTSNAPVILFATDAQGVLTIYTGKAIAAAGQTLGDFLGRDFREARTFDPTTVDCIRRALEGVESSAVGHGLRDTTFETSFTPLRDASGNIAGMVGVSVNITERTRAEAALRESQALMSSIVDSTSDLIWSVEPERFGLLTFNTALRDNFLRRGVRLQAGMRPEDAFSDRNLAERWRGIYQRALSEGPYTIDHESPTAGSMVVTVNLLKRDGKVFGISVFGKDITQRAKAERELYRLNRALRALSATDQAMVRAQNESELLQETCRILVEEGGYRFAWVGLAEQDEAKTVRPVCHAGIEEGYLETVRITWADTARGRGPTGTAIRTERPVVCQNMVEDPRLGPWREEAGRRGYASSCALPLVVGGRSIGALTVYSARPEAFDTAEAELLTQLGADLAFGMEALRTRVERQRSMEALKAERQRLFGVLETLPPMIRLLTPDYHIAFANRAFREKFGESKGRPCYEYCFGLTAPCEFCESYKVLKTGQPHRWEVNLADGSVIDAYDFPFTDADGSPMILEMDFDITEAKKAKENLEKASAYNRSLLEASLDPLVTISPDGKITDVNRAAEKVTGDLRQELIGADFSDYFTQPEKARSGYQQVFKEGRVHDFELEVRHRDGSITPVLYNASVYRDEKGEVAGVFAAARDITTRKRAEEEVRRLNEELEQRVQLRTAQLEASNKELEAFTYSVSHDLRAPLRALDGFSRILLEEYRHHLPAEAQKYLDFVRGGAVHMGKLIDGLLALSRLGRQDLKKRPVDVSEIVRQSMDDLRTDCEGRAVEFTLGALPACEADPLLLRQVFVNLLSNALKFSRKQEKVRIEVGALKASELAQPLVAREPQAGVPGQPPLPRALDPDSWVYYVRDNGVGFDMRYADKLFGVFQRLHRQEEFKGTGIGLATVQQIIHKHGGQVWAEAEVDKGATFYFTIGSSTAETTNSHCATPA